MKYTFRQSSNNSAKLLANSQLLDTAGGCCSSLASILVNRNGGADIFCMRFRISVLWFSGFMVFV